MTDSDPVQADRRQAYNKKIAVHLVPLWKRFGALATPTPQPSARPVCWRFADLRAHLFEAGQLLSTDEAERRVLVLENPGMPGKSRVADSLRAGVQMLLPGERAGSHRHMAGALRVILEGSGA
jgi:gentisate 1,2-dioxygenase